MGMTRLEQLYLMMEVASCVCSPTMMWPCRMSCFVGPAAGFMALMFFAGLLSDFLGSRFSCMEGIVHGQAGPPG